MILHFGDLFPNEPPKETGLGIITALASPIFVTIPALLMLSSLKYPGGCLRERGGRMSNQELAKGRSEFVKLCCDTASLGKKNCKHNPHFEKMQTNF